MAFVFTILPSAMWIAIVLRVTTVAVASVFTISRAKHAMGTEIAMMDTRVKKDVANLTSAVATEMRDVLRVRFALVASAVPVAMRMSSVLMENFAIMVTVSLAARETTIALEGKAV